MAEKDPGLHKDIASIFQDQSVKKDQKQNLPDSNESESREDIFSELLTPSHLVSEANETQQQQEQQAQKQDLDAQEQTEQSPEVLEEHETETVSDEETKIVSETIIHQQPDSVEETTGQESLQSKVISPQPVAQLSRIRKILQDLHDRLLAHKPGVDPRRQKLMIVLIPILSIVMIVILTQVFKTPQKKVNPIVETTTTDVIQTSSEIKWQMPPLYPETLRDPMKAGSVSTSTATHDDIVVKGILYSQDNPAALIADKIIHEGEEIFGAKVLKITKNDVQFEKDGQTWTQEVQK
jgi:hypothetical protein